MWSTLRAMLVWLVVLVMPVQGLAAAGMLHCAAGHGNSAAGSAPHGGAAGGPPAHPGVFSDAPVHPASVPAGEVHHGAMHDGVMHGGVMHSGGGLADDPAASAHGCSACAACCAALALPGGLWLTIEPSGPTFDSSASPGAAPSFVPPGLERPPRVRSA